MSNSNFNFIEKELFEIDRLFYSEEVENLLNNNVINNIEMLDIISKHVINEHEGNIEDIISNNKSIHLGGEVKTTHYINYIKLFIVSNVKRYEYNANKKYSSNTVIILPKEL